MKRGDLLLESVELTLQLSQFEDLELGVLSEINENILSSEHVSLPLASTHSCSCSSDSYPA